MALRLVRNLSILVRTAGINKSLTNYNAQQCLKPVAIQCHILPMAHNYSTKLPDIATYEEVKNLPNKPDTLLIDVREPAELIETGVVPTSINIPLGQVAEKLAKDFSDKEFLKSFNRKKPSFDTELIFMCKIGKRSQNAMEISRSLGYKKLAQGTFLDHGKSGAKSKGFLNK